MAKCSIKKLKQNIRSRKHFQTPKREKKEIIKKKKLLLKYERLINYFSENKKKNVTLLKMNL